MPGSKSISQAACGRSHHIQRVDQESPGGRAYAGSVLQCSQRISTEVPGTAQGVQLTQPDMRCIGLRRPQLRVNRADAALPT